MNNNIDYFFRKADKIYSKSPLYEFRNQTWEWFATDYKELYEKNLIHKHKLMEENDWIGKSIEYKLNGKGLRCEDFDRSANDNIMFLGCSFTFGVGLNVEQRWSTIVSNKLKMREVNFGIPGGSHDYCLRMLVRWLTHLNPKMVVMLSPPNNRYEYIDYKGKTKDGYVHNGEIITNISVSQKQIKDMFYFHDMYLCEPSNTILNFTKNVLAIEQFCQYHNVKFIWNHSSDTYDDFGKKHKTDYARDLNHYGVKTNIDMANHVLEQIG